MDEQIIVNGRFLSRPVTGVERFARELLGAIAVSPTAACRQLAGRLLVVVPKKSADCLIPGLASEAYGERQGHLWEQMDLPVFAAKRLVLNLCSTSPLIGKNLVCLHDAHPWLIPKNYSMAFRLYYRAMLPLMLKRSAHWMTVSKFSRETISQHCNIKKPPLMTLGNGWDHVLRSNPVKPQGIRTLDHPFIFAIGSRSPNKNIDLIKRIAPVLAQNDVKTVIAGGGNIKIFGNGAEDVGDFVSLGRVSDAELNWLYKNALCLAFPSFYEGFGIPILEAMGLGCPVISSNTSAMPEVAGDAAVLLDPNEDQKWIEEILDLKSPLSRESLVQKGRDRAKSFMWGALADQFSYKLLSAEKRV